MESLVTGVVAVIGTLLGAVVTGVLQQRLARSERLEVQQAALRRERLASVSALAAALSEHRRAMWVREDLRLSGAPSEAYERARAESHATRAAITAPLTAVKILSPVLADAADTAVRACYDLRAAVDHDTLNSRRAVAIEAADRLVSTAAAHI
ncbi:protein kilB [Streptomyces acidiscabies]|uniref:protein kilB n=1 Tax=Streptomyces acidiscabies TaxID=42234 RepID=UPI00076E75F2|nr:protein kilB [Streptomyces acidiscabies]GAQ58754.1 hypothetical protein a10_08650 [Streptomyces acidiscabies]